MVFGLSALPLTLTGRRSRVLAIRRTWLGIGRPSDRPSPMPLMLPLATVSFLLVTVALLTVYTGEQYPLRPETVGHLDGMFTSFPPCGPTPRPPSKSDHPGRLSCPPKIMYEKAELSCLHSSRQGPPPPRSKSPVLRCGVT